MKVDLPLAFPVKIRFIIYRDSLCIFLFSKQGFFKKEFNFRLTPDFWFNPDSQIEYILQFIKLIEKELNFQILLKGKLIPAELSPEIDSYELVVRKDKSFVSNLLAFFNAVIERNFEGFSPYFEKFDDDNYLYIDYDVDFFGLFASCKSRKIGGYWNLDYLFYEKLELSSFLEQSVFDLDVRSSRIVFQAIVEQIEIVLRKHKLDFGDFAKLYWGGITSEYLDIRNTDLRTKSDLEIIEDQHFKLLLSSEKK